jgi:hypothetical protein
VSDIGSHISGPSSLEAARLASEQRSLESDHDDDAEEGAFTALRGGEHDA